MKALIKIVYTAAFDQANDRQQTYSMTTLKPILKMFMYSY